MITSALIYILSMILGMVAFILPDFRLFPDIVYDSVKYFVDRIMELNTIFFYIDNILIVVSFFLKFLIYFMLYLLAMKIINLLRGSGEA